MAQLVKITGLQRGPLVAYSAAGTASGTLTESGTAWRVGTGLEGPAAVAGFRVPHAIGRQYSFDSSAKVAALTISNVVFYANYAGTYGNNIKVGVTVTGATTSVTTTYTASTANPTITVTVPTGSKAGDVVTAIDADPTARQFVTAYAASNTAAASTVSAASLSGGTDGSTLDAEPPYGVAGEPIWFNVTDQSVAVVDTTSRVTQRSLQRNAWRYISLGSA